MPWPKSMRLIDANVILRYLLDDNPEMTEQAIEVINSGTYTKPEIMAEVVYVLQKVYSIPRPQIKNMLNNLLGLVYCYEKTCVLYAIGFYADTGLDFADCLLIAYHRINKENVFSFDRKLNKYLDN